MLYFIMPGVADWAGRFQGNGGARREGMRDACDFCREMEREAKDLAYQWMGNMGVTRVHVASCGSEKRSNLRTSLEGIWFVSLFGLIVVF